MTADLMWKGVSPVCNKCAVAPAVSGSATLIAKYTGFFMPAGGCVEGKSILSYTVFGNEPRSCSCARY